MFAPLFWDSIDCGNVRLGISDSVGELLDYGMTRPARKRRASKETRLNPAERTGLRLKTIL
jgi:hypothetical protein